jgi:hypothetical protein
VPLPSRDAFTVFVMEAVRAVDGYLQFEGEHLRR